MKTALDLAKAAKEASISLRTISTKTKNEVLQFVAFELDRQRETLQAENQKDIQIAKENGLSSAMIDRLTLSDKVIDSMIKGLHEVIALPDPVGKITDMTVRPNGLWVGKMQIPLGVIGFIYESRPNVTIDAAALCLKSGNAIILKGGKEAIYSNTALSKIMDTALAQANIPTGAIGVALTTDRQFTKELIGLENWIDVVIPRGGEGLVRFVAENAKIPILKHYDGICHAFIDASADFSMAEEIVLNAKIQRPSTCNALETLLVHKEIAAMFLPNMVDRLQKEGVMLKGDDKTRVLFPNMIPATEEDWKTEYLDLVLSIKIVSDINEAINHIDQYGSNHTETIVTNDYTHARQFLSQVDASLVLTNASTRLNDGGELGLGAEIGISTSKLHAYGAMGLKELTTTKFIAMGTGQIRE